MSNQGKWSIALACLLVIFAGCSSPPAPPPPDGTFTPEPELVVPTNIVSTSNLVVAPQPSPVPVAIKPVTNNFDYSPSWISLERWCHGYNYTMPKRGVSDGVVTYSIIMTNGTLKIQVGSRNASWRGIEFRLGFPPQLIDGHPYVTSLDLRKNFLPLLDRPFLTIANPVIVIDPGHGGTDTGTSNVFNGRPEKEFTLDVARRLQTLLATNGWTVLLTRTNDTEIKLHDRVAFADLHKANLFVSLHFNSSYPDERETGLETYCLTPKGMPSTLTRNYRDDSSLTFANNQFDEENMQLAATIHREILKINGDVDRGVRHARFLGVLQGQGRPAILIEGGYLSNHGEARHLADPMYREKLAGAIAQGLQDIRPLSRPTAGVSVIPASPAKDVRTNMVHPPADPVGKSTNAPTRLKH